VNDPGNQRPQGSETGDVMFGMGLTLLAHLLQMPLSFLTGGMNLIAIGLTQLLYVIPGIIIASRKGRKGIVKGIIIMAAITFLLNAACWGFIMVALSGL
jgi:hypothetical protein